MSELMAPSVRRVRAYFAPAGQVFDAAGLREFDVDAPSSPWRDLGWCAGFTRKCGTKVEALVTGSPGMTTGQVRSEVEAEVALEFESWGKVQMALSCGAQQMNVLVSGTDVLLPASSTASSLNVGSAVGGYSAGDFVAVDVDYDGGTGAVGAGLAGGYVRSGASINDLEYVRRVTLNVGRVSAVNGTVLTLEAPLPAGVPAAGMKASQVAGFYDREGATFFQEWAGLFVADGTQGDRVAWMYPRLQTMAGAAETRQELDGVLGTLRLAGRWRALPVVDAEDGERVVCFRAYWP